MSSYVSSLMLKNCNIPSVEGLKDKLAVSKMLPNCILSSSSNYILNLATDYELSSTKSRDFSPSASSLLLHFDAFKAAQAAAAVQSLILKTKVYQMSGDKCSIKGVDLKSQTTIGQIKKALGQNLGINSTLLRLFVKGNDGNELFDSKTLGDLAILNSDLKELDLFLMQTIVADEKEVLLGLIKPAPEAGPWAGSNLNWAQGKDIAQWDGVTLNEAGQVVGLDVSFKSLSGPIPPQLEQLTALKGLGLNNNQLTGPIPPQLGQLAELEDLYLNNNQLTGPIPHQLGDLSKLQGLSLENNQLTGPIPPDLGQLTALETLHLRYNQLNGPIPPQLGQLAELKELYLNNNQLTGTIPHQLGDLSKLQGLGLNHNQLTDPIPPQLGQLAELEELYLNNNQLTGPIPPELEARRDNGLYVAI